MWQSPDVRQTTDLDSRWTITGHINGGYLCALVCETASAFFDGAPPLTASVHYLSTARGGGPADVEVDELRRSRLSTARVRLGREGTPLLESLVTAGTPKPGEQQLDHAARPDVPPREECPEGWTGDAPGMDLLAHLDVRLAPAVAAAFGPGGAPLPVAEATGWVTYADGAPADRFLALAAWDVLPPTLWTTHLWTHAPTVNAQVVLFPGAIEGPLLVQARADTLAEGVVDETARVWDVTGRLVLSSRQTALAVPAHVAPVG